MVRGDAALQRLQPLPVAQDLLVLLGQRAGPALHQLADPVRLLGAVEPQTGPQALLDGGLAPGPAEQERDRGQQPLAVEPGQHVGAAGHRAAVSPTASRQATGAAAGRQAPLVAGEPLQLGVDPVAGAVHEQVVQPGADHDVLGERYGAVLLDDHLGVAAHRPEPLAELLGVAHRRRQRRDLHVLGQVDDHLLPHRAPLAVGEVVHLVHHHVGQAPQPVRPAVAGGGLGPGVQHVAQHLGGHHDHVGVTVDGVVAGQQADPVGAVTGNQVAVLLVGQGLDRGRVEALAACRQGQMDGELTDDGLARAGRGGHQDTATRLEGSTGGALEAVQPERVTDLELGERRAGLTAPESGVPLGRRCLRCAHLVRLRPWGPPGRAGQGSSGLGRSST